jgi:hypothetical protein
VSWFRSEIEGHERRLLYMREHGLKLDRDTAIDDLRVWQDRVMAPGSKVEMPSARDLAKRWGWPKTNAHRLLVDFESWSDPSRLEAWRVVWDSHGTKAGQPRDTGGTIRNGQTPTNAETRDTGGTAAGQPRDTSGHTRVVDHPPPPPPPPPEQKPARERKAKPKVEPPTDHQVRSGYAAWKAAWGDQRPMYPWAPAADRKHLTAAAESAGIAADVEPTPEQLERLTAAMRVYIAEAEAERAFPPGPPTIQKFHVGRSEWLLKAAQPLKLVGKHAHDRAPPRAEPPPETPEARAKRVAEEEEAIRQWEAEIAAREAAKQQQQRRRT